MNKSVFGLTENLAAALSYVVVFFSGVVVLILERENKFVRFHALQSTLFFLFYAIFVTVVNFILSIPFLGAVLGILVTPVMLLLGIVVFFVWLFLIFKAFQNETYKLPFFGDVAYSQIYK
ncbi:MAG: hypothetical protein FWC16_04655 [Defluviitaleaceae bacterium]|nr:hypothetical protein [Defluviitaleaceae bacterium]MCL2274197.1 hypothetical protein [Defluviitaleaceae bacterium]